MISRKELIEKYLKFFESKGHKLIPNVSLIPKNDPAVLFTTAGMHPLIPYLLGQKHPLGKKLCSVQKCIRTTDIEEVGDTSHHTFIEMLGNWSLGDYWKKEAIGMSSEFLTKNLKIPTEKINVTCFKGDQDAPKDIESVKIWKSLGIKKIKFLGKKDNWWGPASETGPCGPDTEMFVDGFEIWNDVFMQYNKTKEGKFIPLRQKNIDTGMGVERTLAVLNGLDDDYLTEVFKSIIEEIEDLSGKKYEDNKKAMRIIADHIKAAVFIIADGITPSNTEQGYVLRRLIRRAVRWGMRLDLKNFTDTVAQPVFDIYPDYPELKKNKKNILNELIKEEDKFNKTLQKGLIIFNKLTKNKKTLSGKDAFLLYQSYGFPIELTKELAGEKKIKIDLAEFNRELKKHQKLSRTASAGKFKSGLADYSEKTTRFHTATHLLNEALRRVLDEEIRQKGSNITPERLRFDFNFPRKLTEQEIKKIEDLINKKIREALPVKREEMSLKKALASGAQSEFGAKYPEIISVYSIGDFSKEICTGPHVKNTREIGKFKIIKEKSSAAGVRRIKAVIE
jgi:alanyl-tRNA synthetase